VYDISALKFACMMVIEAGVVPHIAALLSDIFDIRKEVMLLKNIYCLFCSSQSDHRPVNAADTVKPSTVVNWLPDGY